MHALWPTENLHLRLFDARHISLPATVWDTPNVRSSFWRFYLNANDGGWLDLPETSMELHAGTPYLVPSGVLFTCRNVATISHFFIHFDVLGLPEPLRREQFGVPVTLPPSTSMNSIVRTLSTLSQGHEAGLERDCLLKAVLFLALGGALGQISDAERERYVRFAAAGAMLQPALQFIESNLGEPLPNERLAALCYLSPDHFIRRFRESLGQTPAAYVQERRIMSAAQMLLLTDQNLDKIASATGFGNRFYFSRIFGHHFQISPAAYRKAGDGVSRDLFAPRPKSPYTLES